MISLSTLKRDLEISRGLGDIIDVLKTAAVIQFHALQEKEKPEALFLDDVESCISLLLSQETTNPFFMRRQGRPSLIVLLTSDEGFLGELNSVLINAALEQKRGADDEIVVLGDRGARALEEMEMAFLSFPGIGDEINPVDAERVRDYCLQAYRSRFGRVIVVYPKFFSLSYQKVEAMQLLPYTAPSARDERMSASIEEDMIEPSARSVVESLIEIWMGYKFLDIFWSSKQSEYAARIMHLEGSTQELAHMNHNLSLSYFRQVHALRDKSIREISASKNLLGKK